MVFHQGLWHAGQPNPGDTDRWLYKIRLNPREPQVRLWNTDDFEALHNDPRDHTFAHMRGDSVAQIFRKMEPWQKGHEARYEQMQRTKLWRYLSGDDGYDVDYYHTRIEGRARTSGSADGAPADPLLSGSPRAPSTRRPSPGRSTTAPRAAAPRCRRASRPTRMASRRWRTVGSSSSPRRPTTSSPGLEHETSYLPNEFVFERRVSLEA